LRRDQAAGNEPEGCQHPDQRGERAEGRTWFHGPKAQLRAVYFDARIRRPSSPLVTVEKPDVMNLAEECRQHDQKNQKLYLPCAQVIHLLS
jgi:hypothetical protein